MILFLYFGVFREILASFDLHYENGITAYHKGQWRDAIFELEKAISDRKNVLAAKSSCSISCSKVSGKQNEKLLGNGFAQYVLVRAACIKNCIGQKLSEDYDYRVIPEIEEQFKRRDPYQYLNVAYYNLGLLSKAVAAAYTYFNVNPMLDENKLTMEFYIDAEAVTEEMYIDLETKIYITLYESAVHAYQVEDYPEAIKLFTNSITEYYKEMEICRALAEEPFDFGSSYEERLPTFHKFQVLHLSQLLQNRLKCIKQLENKSGEYNRRQVSDFLPIQYHYLMFASHESGNNHDAVKYAKTYMMFHPDNVPMRDNFQYFDMKNSHEIEIDENAKEFYKAVQADVKLLNYMEEHLRMEFDYALLTPFPDESLFEAENEEYMNKDIDWENIDLSTTTPWDPDHKSEEPKETQPITAPIYKTPLVKDTSIGYESGQEKINDILYDPALEKQQKMIQTPHGEFPDYDLGQKFGMVIKLSPKYKAFDDGPVVKSEGPVPDYAQLKLNSTLMFGPTRFVMDYVITEEECKTLAGLSDSANFRDNGYNGDPTPHSSGEEFFGITLLRSAELAQKNLASFEAVKLYHHVNVKLAKIVQEYFKLDEKLYTDYVHLVCRSPTDKITQDENGNEILSHPLHPDNCLLMTDGSCPRREPAYIWREYSAVLYLNGDIEGGEVLFSDKSGKYGLVGVKPKCGRLVGFCAGTDCLHAVRKMTKGRRCVLPVWYTTRKDKEDFTLPNAIKIIEEIEARNKIEL